MEKEIAEESGFSGRRERVDVFCARAILFIFLFVLVWGPLAFGGKTQGAFLVIQGATVAALAVWIVRFWVQRPFRLLWPPMCWGVLAFLLYAIARCRIVEVEYAGRQQLVHVLVYGALFFLALNNLNRKHSTMLVSLTLITLGFALAVLAVFQFSAHYQSVWGAPIREGYWERGSGTFLNPDHLADFLCMTAPLALGYTVIGRSSAIGKVLLAYAAVAMLAGIVVSVSRGGIVTAIVTLVLFCAALLSNKDFWRPALVLLCVLTALTVGAATQFDSLQKRFVQAVKQERGGDERTFYWESALKLFGRDRVWGVGPGHFDIEFPTVRPMEVQDRPTYAHNDYLNTLCDWGIVGLGIIAAACGLLGWSVIQVWGSQRRSSSRETSSKFSDRLAFVVGASVAVLAVMLHCFIDFNMQVPALAVTVVTLMALLVAQVRFATERYWQNPGRAGKILLTIITVSAIGYLSVQGARKGAETYWLDRAQAKDATPDSAMTCMTKAHEAEPMNWETDYTNGLYLWEWSLEEGSNSLDRTRQAFGWYAKSMELNPFDAYSMVGCGACLDRLGKIQEATPYFRDAILADPRNEYIELEVARHCTALGELDAAKRWLSFQGARKWGGEVTDLAYAEAAKLDQLMADPLWVASAKISNTNKLEPSDPLVVGPK